ncbi:hypothetical protein [Anaerotignum lactatifermentans]|uniref:hypothetical protein n=1 Tax=Anaerotignum lactatifermentans TaxID=160404 RepID=UPI00255C5E73|nr:hypothetical protein [Anaerotignum lactatifermentans]
MRSVDEINDAINSRYDRITVLIPKGTKWLIEDNIAATTFNNISAYIRALVEADYCGAVDWEAYFDHENYGILLRMADRQKTQPITDYRAKLR